MGLVLEQQTRREGGRGGGGDQMPVKNAKKTQHDLWKASYC
jgi:hypothetical protein